MFITSFKSIEQEPTCQELIVLQGVQIYFCRLLHLQIMPQVNSIWICPRQLSGTELRLCVRLNVFPDALIRTIERCRLWVISGFVSERSVHPRVCTIYASATARSHIWCLSPSVFRRHKRSFSLTALRRHGPTTHQSWAVR